MEDTTVTMKANRMHVFGGPEVILFEDVPRPTPGTGEALVTSFRNGLRSEELDAHPGHA